MKRCAIFFTLLIVTILIAVFTERQADPLPMDEVSMDSSNAVARQDMGVISDNSITD